MQSGSPTFGTPESGIGLLCTGRSRGTSGSRSHGGGLTSSQVADAQGGYEALMTLLPTFLAGTNWVMHSAGWLEGGRGATRSSSRRRAGADAPARVHAAGDRRGSLAFDAHLEVGHGATSSARCIRSSGSHLLLPAHAVVIGELRAWTPTEGSTPPHAPATSTARSPTSRHRRWTTRSVRSSRRTVPSAQSELGD